MTLETPLFSMDVPAKGATKGHVRFALRSNDPDDVAASALCGIVTSAILFERLQAQWTHLIVALRAEKESRIDVLARWEDDGLDLTWEPTAIEPGRMEEIAARIRDKAFLLSQEAQQRQATAPVPVPSGAAVATFASAAPTPQQQERAPTGLADGELTPQEESWEVKQLLRIP